MSKIGKGVGTTATIKAFEAVTYTTLDLSTCILRVCMKICTHAHILSLILELSMLEND